MPAGRLPRKRSKLSNAWSGAAVEAERLQQAGHQLGQEFAGARGRGRAIAAVMPAPHDARGRRGVAKPESRQGFQRAGIVVGAGEDQVAARAGEAGRLLEQPCIMALDAAQAVEQLRLEGAESA